MGYREDRNYVRSGEKTEEKNFSFARSEQFD